MKNQKPVDPRGAQMYTMGVLTERQRVVLDEVARFLHCNGWPPTTRELAEALGLSSTFGVRKHLMELEKKGFIAREPGTARGLRILQLED